MGELREINADVCVVGAGVVGLAHAHEARSRGLSVVVLERSDRALGASVRNFGHGCLAAMADGPALLCGLESRGRWIELAARCDLELALTGTVVVARRPDELAVLEALSRDRRRGARVVDPDEIAELVPIPTTGLVGGLHATLDYRVNPRQAVARLAGLLERDEDAVVVWGELVNEVLPGQVRSANIRVSAPTLVLCPGPDFGTLPPNLRPRRRRLTLCKLQMLRVRSPGGRRYGPALMTGLSLLRYPGFTSLPEAEAVRARITASRPELVEAGIHLIVTQLPDGDLIVGDSHEYRDTPPPFDQERVWRLLLDEACSLLGCTDLEVVERWHGVYPVAPGDPFLVEEPLPGVYLVEVVSGIGMTTSLGLARRVFDQLAPEPRAAAAIEISERPAGSQERSESRPRSAEAHVDYGS